MTMNFAEWVTATVIAIMVALVVLLPGCAPSAPVFVNGETPLIPTECDAASISIETPQLPGAGKREVYEDEAARDRKRLEAALTDERLKRLSCSEQLRELLPQPAKPAEGKKSVSFRDDAAGQHRLQRLAVFGEADRHDRLVSDHAADPAVAAGVDKDLQRHSIVLQLVSLDAQDLGGGNARIEGLAQSRALKRVDQCVRHG